MKKNRLCLAGLALAAATMMVGNVVPAMAYTWTPDTITSQYTDSNGDKHSIYASGMEIIKHANGTVKIIWTDEQKKAQDDAYRDWQRVMGEYQQAHNGEMPSGVIYQGIQSSNANSQISCVDSKSDFAAHANGENARKLINLYLTINDTDHRTAAERQTAIQQAIAFSAGTETLTPVTEAEASNALGTIRSYMPEGIRWNGNDNYSSRRSDGCISAGGCDSFQGLVQDFIFGRTANITRSTTLSPSTIKTGDFIQVQNADGSTHAYIVTAHDNNNVTCVSGNSDGKVHWDDVHSYGELSSKLIYVESRY